MINVVDIINLIITITIIMFRSYIAHITSKSHLYALEALLPRLYPPCSLSALRAFEGINSCWVPIYYTWVERDNNFVDKMPCLGAYAPSGIRTHDPLITSREHEPLNHIASILAENTFTTYPGCFLSSHSFRTVDCPPRYIYPYLTTLIT